MKKVLFATTALIATAGMASAEVKLSGYGRFGLDYEDRPAIAARAATAAWTTAADAVAAAQAALAAATDHAARTAAQTALDAAQDALDARTDGPITGRPSSSETTLTSRLRLQIDMSTETDGGVTFGARYRVQAENRDGTPGVGGFNGARFYVTSGGFTLGVGNIIGAFEGAAGLYLNTTSAGIGIDGSGFGNLAANMAGVNFNWDAYSSAGAGVNGVEVMYRAGNFSAHISHSSGTSRSGNVTTRGENNTAINVSYTFGDWTIAAAHNSEDRAAAGLGRDRDLTFVSVQGDLGVAKIAASYAKGHDYLAAGVDSNKFVLAGYFDVGAATTIAAYVSSEDSPGRATDGTGYGIDVTHDLGGGVSLVAGLNEASNDVTTFQAGAHFRF